MFSLAALLVLGACQAESVPMATEIVASETVQMPRLSALQAGPPSAEQAVENPFAENAYALEEGKRYYAWFNCAGCHGVIGGGGMGPPLADRDWIYGGAPQQIRDSILRGRPNGMPAFAGRLPPDVVWKLVAYVQTLGPDGAEPLSAAVSPPDATADPEKGTGKRAN